MKPSCNIATLIGHLMPPSQEMSDIALPGGSLADFGAAHQGLARAITAALQRGGERAFRDRGADDGRHGRRDVSTRHPDYAVGNIVLGYGGWQDLTVSNGAGLRTLDPAGGTESC